VRDSRNNQAPREITIALGLPDNNSGAAALGISLVKALQRSFPGCKINYISHHADPDLVSKAHPFLREACPDVDILPFPLPCVHDTPRGYSRIAKRLRKEWVQFRAFASLLWLLLPVVGRLNRTCNAIHRSDLLVARGTNIFFDTPGRRWARLPGYYAMCFPFLYAWRAGTPYVIYAHSFGPLHDSLRRGLIGFVLRKALLVLPREPLSRDFVEQELGVPSHRLRLVPDSVFGWLDPESIPPPPKPEAMAAFGDAPYFCVTIRAGMAEENSHVTAVAGAIRDMLAADERLRCVVVMHCHPLEGYPGYEDDRATSRLLVDAVGMPGRVVLVDRALSPSELLAIYRDARFVAGMRLHSVILSIVAGTPALAISYWGNKTAGIMKMAGLEHLLFDFRNVDRTALADAMRRLADDNAAERARVAGVRDRLHRQALETPELVRDAWLAR
jgi:colanic acid/amylovoran biosynthesis protein